MTCDRYSAGNFHARRRHARSVSLTARDAAMAHTVADVRPFPTRVTASNSGTTCFTGSDRAERKPYGLKTNRRKLHNYEQIT